jgi:hypothetical protein
MEVTVSAEADPEHVRITVGLRNGSRQFGFCESNVSMKRLSALLGATGLSLMLLIVVGCSPAARQNAATALAAAGAGASGNSPAAQRKIMLFGGHDHRTYLGCLSCSEYVNDSVFNAYGNYGSRYSSTSIWNHYADFGSRYSNEGACNPYATDPPVIVDMDGNYYGRLTLNRYHPQIAAGSKFHGWLEQKVCEE